MQKVVLVTGANKGIGFEIAKKFGEYGFKTILGCRNEELGKQAESSLKAFGYNVEFRQLDISDLESINKFTESFSKDYDHLDILINNAAILFKDSDPTPFSEQARPTMLTNYFGTLSITESLLPMLKNSSDPRVIFVASEMGHLRILTSQEKKDQFSDPNLSINTLNMLVKQFIQAVESSENLKLLGWPQTCYGMSKLAIISLTKVLAREYPDIVISSCCPGWCDTDMTSHKGPRSPELGARTPFMLGITKEKNISGKFYADEKEIVW